MTHLLRTHRRAFLGLTVWCVLALFIAPAAGQSIQGRVDKIIRSMELGRGSLGLHFVDARTGVELAGYNRTLPLIPASNMKLVTTAAALTTLGEDFVFSTQLRLHERTLIIHGDGDPAFGDPEILAALGMSVDELITAWVDAVKQAGVEKLDAIIIDDRVFDQQFVHPAWPEDQLHKWYCAQVSGIIFNDNCINVYASPTRPGQSPQITIEPKFAAIDLDNGATTGDKNGFWAARRIGTNQMVMRGEVKHSLAEPIYVTVHDPSMFFGETLARQLRAAGITADKVVRAEPNETLPAGRLLAEVKTTLPTVVVRCNRDSQNLFAEAMLKRLGRHVTGQPGSWANGSAAARMVLTRILGTDAASVVIDDGSGMSRKNRVTAEALTDLLSHMIKQPSGPTYRASLAAPGEDGTLENRFKGVDMRGEVRAKSGYISGVVSLSGYITYDNRVIAFSMIVNNYDKGVWRAKDAMEKIIIAVDAELARQSTVKLGG